METTPLYLELKERLLEAIREGQYGPDGRLPTEAEICQQYGLSRTPVARALSELAAEGVVIRHRRRGTFVNLERLRAAGDGPQVSILATGEFSVEYLRRVAALECRPVIQNVGPGELHAAFLQAIAQGRGPDLAVLDSVWVAEFAKAGFLTPLGELDPDWVTKEHDADFLAPFVDAYRFGESTVAVQAPSDVVGLWFERATLRRLGAEPPTTWRELQSLGRRLAGERTSGSHVLAMPGGRGAGETTTYALLALLAANGATVLSDHAVTLNSPAAVETMRFLRRLVDDGVLSPEVVEHPKEHAIQLLADGAAEMCVGASYQGGDLAEAGRLSIDEVHERFGFGPVPHGPHGRAAVLCGGLVYVIPRQARHPEVAMRVIRAITAPGTVVPLCLRTGQLPPRRSALAEIAAVSPFHAQTAALLDQAVLRPVTPAYALVSAQIRAMAEEVLTRRRGPAAAVARAADLISAITMLPAR